MGAFGLLRNGLALIAGVALLDVIFEEIGDKPTCVETDSEKNYRENCEKMAQLKVDDAEAKVAKAEGKVAAKNEEITKLRDEMKQLMARVQKLSEDVDTKETAEIETVSGEEKESTEYNYDELL